MTKDYKISNSQFGERVSFYSKCEIENCEIGSDVSIGNGAIVLNSVINDFVSLNRRNYVLRSKIGSFTYTGIGTSIRSSEVGKFCSLAWNISIGGGNHDFDKITTSPLWRFYKLTGNDSKIEKTLKKRYDIFGDSKIGNDVWIASNAIILRNVSIGNGAVIGAGAVVTKDVEPYTIVAGVPAKPIKKRFDDDIINTLEDLAWWNWPVEVIKKNLDLIYSTKVDDSVIMKLKKIKKEL